jgi:hypothetical protein
LRQWIILAGRYLKELPKSHKQTRTSNQLGARYMNLVHEPVHVPMVMSWSQLAQPSGCNIIFGLLARRLCCNKKIKYVIKTVPFFEILLKCAVLASFSANCTLIQSYSMTNMD